MLGAWCEERRGYGVAYIGARASTTMETNQAPPWLRYTEDRENAQEDWELAEPGVVRPHHGCARTLGAPPSLGFCLGAHAYVWILEMLVLGFDSAGSASDKVRCT